MTRVPTPRSSMKKSSVIFPFVLFAGIQLLPAQDSRPTVQIDFWNWYSVKPPVQAQDIVIDPDSDSTWYVASNSGLYITNDAGNTWVQTLTDPVGRGGIAIDPTNPNRIFVGAGTSIYVSNDRGLTWSKGGYFPQKIARVFVSPTDGSVLVGPLLASGFSGVYRSFDHGTSWTPVSYGASFAAVVTTWDIQEDGSGQLWAATEALPLTSGKNMVLLSADRGASWADISGSVTAPASKLVWDSFGQAMYGATRNGVIVTGNQGARWSTFLQSPSPAVSILPIPAFLATPTPVVLAGLDATSGGGAAFAFAMLHVDLIGPGCCGPARSTAMGPEGVAIQALTLTKQVWNSVLRRRRRWRNLRGNGHAAKTRSEPHRGHARWRSDGGMSDLPESKRLGNCARRISDLTGSGRGQQLFSA